MSTGRLPNARLDVERLTVALVLVPVPVRLTDCGLPVALSVTVTAAVRVPLAAGVKVTLIVQLAPAGTELPQVLVWAKSLAFVPVIARLEIPKAALPELFTMTVCALLELSTGRLPKLRLAGDRFTARESAAIGTAAVVPPPQEAEKIASAIKVTKRISAFAWG